MPWLQTSAGAAAKVCVGGPPDGVVCGRKWYVPQDDGTRDLGNQMTAMAVVQANLIKNAPPLANHQTGTSTGNAGAGNGEHQPTSDEILASRPLTMADTIGGWLITAIMIVTTTGWVIFLLFDQHSWDSMFSAYNGSFSQRWYGR
jgi:hypothetical protein